MKIAVFTISLGKYDIFFNEFYNSVNNLFLPNHEKQFFVFTDKSLEEKDNLTQIKQDKLGWPYDTMMRFHFMSKIKDELLKYDYIYFFNINMKVLKEIKDEVIPHEENDFLVGADHPIHSGWPGDRLPYERNKNSEFYIPFGYDGRYYQGCFNGGKSNVFINMCEVLKDKIDNDLSKGIVPKWHDESALNWFFKDKRPLFLSKDYIYPESFPNYNEKKMIQVDKWKFMNKEELRG